MQQTKALKEQVDATQHKEAVLKARIQPWIDEAFTIIAEIERKLTQTKGTQAQMQEISFDTTVSEQRV